MSSTAVDSPIRTRLVHTRLALGHSRASGTWRAAFRLRPATPALDPAIRVGIAIGIVLIVGGLLGEPQLAALAALGAVSGAFARNEPYRRRAGKVLIAGLFILGSVALGAAVGTAPEAAQIAALSALAGLAVWALSSLRVFGPGAVIIVFAGSAAVMADSVPRALAATAFGVAVGWLCAVAPLTRVANPAKAHWIRDGIERMRTAEMLGAGARIFLAGSLAGIAALALGLHHPVWATMGATAAMQSVTFASTVERAIQRLAGNVTGALLAVGVILLGLGYWPTAAVIVALIVLTEILVMRNYALATTTVTPMGLLMMGIAVGITPEMAVSRVVDTAIGVVIGVVVAAVTISTADRQHLPEPCLPGA